MHPNDHGERSPAGRVRFLLSGDWQLGMTRHFLDQDAQARYTAARIDVIDRIGVVAREHECEFVVVCGDVFESNAVSPRIIARAIAALSRIEVPVYLLPGNHYPLDAESVYRSRAFTAAVPGHVRVLDASGAFSVRPGIDLVAAPWFSKHPGSDLVAAAVADLSADRTVRIVVGHGAVSSLSPDRSDPAVISVDRLQTALHDAVIHAVVLGDRHSVTEVGDGRIWYAGTPEVTDFDERDPGRVLVMEVGADGVQATQVRVGTWSFVDLTVPMDGDEDISQLDATLSALPARDRCVVRLAMRGTVSPAERGRLDDVLDGHRLALAGLLVREKFSDIAVVVDPAEFGAWGFGGFVLDAVTDLAATAAGPGPDSGSARDALALLYRLTAPRSAAGAGR